MDGALAMTSPAVTDQVVEDCAKLRIPRVWMYRAGGEGRSVEFCEEQGIAVAPGECPYMFFPESGWIHRFH